MALGRKKKIVIEELVNPDFMDLITAIQKGISEASVLPLGNDNLHKSIGYLCKVYWDQDDVWYTGRVLLHDPIKKKHLIYFDVDGTMEWIDTSQSSGDYVLLVEEIVIHESWPAMKFVGSDLAMAHLQKSRFSERAG